MRTRRALLILTALLIGSAELIAQELYAFVENRLHGFVDADGDVVIPARFMNVGDFNGGLAPARVKGTYGYVDTKGEFVIAPRFDFAEPFDNGVARVYIDAKPYLIDRSGEILFAHDYVELSLPMDGRVIVTTRGFEEGHFAERGTMRGGRQGVVDLQGGLIVDTIYQKISPFVEGRAVVEMVVEGRDPNDWGIDVGVIDADGRIIVPLGLYDEIESYSEGFAMVGVDDEPVGFVDREGRLAITIDTGRYEMSWRSVRFSGGCALLKRKGRQNSYAILRTSGDVVELRDTFSDIMSFHQGRAFAQISEERWVMIDDHGRRVTDREFAGWRAPEFSDGVAYIRSKGITIAIDRDGNVLGESSAMREADHIQTIDGVAVGIQQQRSADEEYIDRFSFWDVRSSPSPSPWFQIVDARSFRSKRIRVIDDDRIGYVDRRGEYVWRARLPRADDPRPLDIDVMLRGYFYASSRYRGDEAFSEYDGYGGWGGSENSYRFFGDSATPSGILDQRDLSIVIDTAETIMKEAHMVGRRFFLVNGGGDTILFDAQDSRLEMTIQARDEQGAWKDIMYLPSSWCGNSYHTLFLPPSTYWSFVMPVFAGENATMLRIEVAYELPQREKVVREPRSIEDVAEMEPMLNGRGTNDSEILYLYSEEFPGHLNPGQYWRRLEYTPRGLMDPY